MRRALVLSLGLVAAAGCGGSSSNSSSQATYHANTTTKCLEKHAGVLVTPTPNSQLGQFPGATNVLNVSFSLAHETPPPQAIVMFARLPGEEPRMEKSLDQLVHTAMGESVRRLLHRSGNVAWVWIGPHGAAQTRALRRCLS